MLKFLNTLIFLQICSFSHAQTLDYKSVRDSLTLPSCGKVDSSTLNLTLHYLENFDPNSVIFNRQLYFHDLGWCYYRLYMKTQNTQCLHKAISAYEKALIIKPDYGTCLWNIACCEYLIGNCDQADKYMDRYKNITEEKYWDRKQMDLFSAKCRN